MPSKNVLKMGTPSLLEKSKPVTEFSCANVYDLIQDLTNTMKEYGGVGIAAPQIGHNLRVIMFSLDFNPRYPNEKPIPFTVLINPEMELLTDQKIEGWEGCLSVPGLRGMVSRYTNIKYKGYDAEGNMIERMVDGFHARVFQHEYDHIEGILFPQRITDMKNFGFENELRENGIL